MFFLKEKVLKLRGINQDLDFHCDGFKVKTYTLSESTKEYEDDEHDETYNTSPPIHPVYSMQSAFNESMRDSEADNRSRRVNQFHPIRKLVAQIAFGLHLLHKHLAKSPAEVVKILQRHVDEVNKFLNSTTQNFDQALSDIEERQRNLKSAIDNPLIFENMLISDEIFQEQIIYGNKNIDYIIKKNTASMEAGLRDVYEAMLAVEELGKYLSTLKKGWKNTGLIRSYGVMTSNVQVWGRSLETMRKVGLKLAGNLDTLRKMLTEVEKMVKKSLKSLGKTKDKKSSPTTTSPISIVTDLTPPTKLTLLPNSSATSLSPVSPRTIGIPVKPNGPKDPSSPARPKREDERSKNTPTRKTLRELKLEQAIEPPSHSKSRSNSSPSSSVPDLATLKQSGTTRFRSPSVPTRSIKPSVSMQNLNKALPPIPMSPSSIAPPPLFIPDHKSPPPDFEDIPITISLDDFCKVELDDLTTKFVPSDRKVDEKELKVMMQVESDNTKYRHIPHKASNTSLRTGSRGGSVRYKLHPSVPKNIKSVSTAKA